MKKRRRHKLRRLALVLVETFAWFLGLGAVADGDSSRHLFARLFFSTSNRCVSAIVFSTVAAILTFFFTRTTDQLRECFISRKNISTNLLHKIQNITIGFAEQVFAISWIPYRPAKSTRRKIDSTFNWIKHFRSSHIFTCFIRFRFCLWTRFEQSHLLLQLRTSIR